MGETLKEKTSKGLFWGGLGNVVFQLLNLIIGVFLGRLLSPSDYGMVGVLTVFSGMAGVFAESGFILALVNKKEIKHEDYNSVFWVNILIGLILYAILFFSAPFIADFYHKPELTKLARFLFLGFFIGSFGTAQTAYFFRNLMVKARSQIQITAILVSGIVNIICAFHGWGYWGMALQSILYVAINTVLLWIASPWHPSFSFRFEPLRELLPFSIKSLFTSLFTHINNNIFSILLGRFYTISEVGHFTQGNKWTTMGYSTVYGMINSVGQPVFREAVHDHIRLRNIFRKLTRFTAFVSFPVMFGLAIISREMIVVTITDKWLPCVPVMQVLCVGGAFIPISVLYSNLMNSIGRPHIYMWSTVSLGVFQLLCVYFSYPYGIYTMLFVYTAINILWLLVWHYFARKHIGLSLLSTLKDIFPYFFISLVVMFVAYIVASTVENIYISLALKIVLAASLYMLLMWKLNSVVFRESLQYLLKKKKMK